MRRTLPVGLCVQAASEEDRETLAWMLTTCLTELRAILGEAESSDPLSNYPWFDEYFSDPTRSPLLITEAGEVIGFALVRQLDRRVHQLAEFFIGQQHRRCGLGRSAATLVFGRFPGPWSVEYDSRNEPAARFWTGFTGARTPTKSESTDTSCRLALTFTAGSDGSLE